MIRLWLLQAAALLLLLQISSIEGLLNLTGCDTTKACWAAEECAKRPEPKRDLKIFYLRDTKVEIDKVNPGCSKYLIVEPGTDHFVFELMHSGYSADTMVTLSFNRLERQGPKYLAFLTCKDHLAGTGDKLFTVVDEPMEARSNAFCRFKITKARANPGDKEFYSTLTSYFEFWKVYIEVGKTRIFVEDFNREIFRGRVPCSKSIFLQPGVGPDKTEYIKTPQHSVNTKEYSCSDNYSMSYKAENDAKFSPLQGTDSLKCSWGKIIRHSDQNVRITSAKCWKHRNTLCDDVCINRNCTSSPDNARRLSIKCRTPFMILNNYVVTRSPVFCADTSKPTDPRWNVDSFLDKKSKTISITDVLCVEELDCYDIAPFGKAECSNCSAVERSGGALTCSRGGILTFIDEHDSKHSARVTCNKNNGEWKLEYDGKSHSANKTNSAKIKLACVGVKPVETTTKPVAAARAGDSLLIVGCSLGVILLLLLILLLIYCICCRKCKEKPKEQPKMEPTPPPSKTDSSAVEVELPAPEPIQPPPSEPEAPAFYSGKRVQFINVSKEHLREIEPFGAALPEEFSARDLTDSEKSKASQVSQVGGTTDGAPTVTGQRATEKTNEVSRTMAANDASRSDVSLGRDSSMGESSQTGAGGNTPTIGNAAAKMKKGEKAAGGGPRVAFRERVSYETDTKTRDKSSMGSMVTAPEQLTQQTQPEGSTVEGKKKDEPSRLTADKARNTFGQEKTRTTQNTKEPNEESVNPNRSKLTDISRTG